MTLTQAFRIQAAAHESKKTNNRELEAFPRCERLQIYWFEEVWNNTAQLECTAVEMKLLNPADSTENCLKSR